MGLSNYELGEELFRSGPSTFFRAQNVVLGNDVMLRRLELDGSRDPADVRSTFFREQRLSASLSHPNIQRPLDAFEEQGHLFSVHEFRDLRFLSQLVREKGPMTVAEAARLGSQVADALAHMHARGLVHGKVTPGNVVLDARNDAVVINLVKAADLQAGIWPLRPAVLGLSPFSAPEEFRGERPTAASDLYGLAGTILYWLTARWPRGGADEEEALARARDGAPLVDLADLRPDVPPLLVERLELALESDAAARRGNEASLGSLLVEIHQRLAAEIPSGFGTGATLRPVGCCDTVEIVGRHGAGAFGVVLRARMRGDGTILAVKALKPEHRDDRNATERFLREARALQQIDHPNVVRIRGVGEENGTPYAVMDFVAGPDLATLLLRDGTLPPPRVARLAAGVARGLQAIHDAGIIHRDMKPHNILVAPGDRPVIADFGVARQAGGTRMTMTGSFVGTPVYMAPEQFEDGPLTTAADLFALGTILYEMLTGRAPFAKEDTVATIRAIREAAPTPLPDDVPEALAAACLRLLQKRPEDRHASAAEAAEEIERAVARLVADEAVAGDGAPR